MATAVLHQLSNNEKLLFENVSAGNKDGVKSLLVEPGVRVDCLDEHGMTPLQQAAFKGNQELCELFLAHGANVNSNYHEHGYTALMFAALSGSVEVTQLMLEAGANLTHENSVHRTAGQMAAFVGQHQCVSLINNFFSRQDLDYYTVPRGVEKESKLAPALAPILYKLMLITNPSPIYLSMYLEEHPQLLDSSYQMSKLLELLCEKMMKKSETNEIMAFRFHYLAHLICLMDKSRKENGGKSDVWIKSLLRTRDEDDFQEMQERFLRSMIKDFPYIESQLIQQMVRNIAPVKIGDSPTAISIISSAINGQRFASDLENACATCSTLKAEKKCSACKMVKYCSPACQKLHWFTHKKFCGELRKKYENFEERRKRAETKEQQKAEETKKEQDEKESRTAEDVNLAKQEE